MSGIGHNRGPSLEAGQSWRRFVWAKARRDLMPTLPIEVVRLRVKRAAELGLPYKTYAGIRAASGQDLIGFMFSTNALRMLKAGCVMPADVSEKLSQMTDARRVAITHPGVTAAQVMTSRVFDASYLAPSPRLSWSQMRDHLKEIARHEGAPADRFLLVGETGLERDWAEAMQAAGFLSGSDYFAHCTSRRPD